MYVVIFTILCKDKLQWSGNPYMEIIHSINNFCGLLFLNVMLHAQVIKWAVICKIDRVVPVTCLWPFFFNLVFTWMDDLEY